MHVFTLPSYPYVLKVIKDEFGHSKQTDRATVKRKFLMVKQIDRVGRMADTLEFKNLALPRDRFAPELLDAAARARAVDDRDRRRQRDRRPLLRRAPDDAAQPLPRDGDAGARSRTSCASTATRSATSRSRTSSRATCSGATSASTAHGRVVFYDYDEIEYLTDCVFRTIPPPPNPEAELSGEPWYPVGPLDVFPEEFETFLLGSPQVREAFMRHHAELLRPEFWQRCQEQVARGEIVDFFPYPEEMRFGRRLRGTRARSAWSLRNAQPGDRADGRATVGRSGRRGPGPRPSARASSA